MKLIEITSTLYGKDRDGSNMHFSGFELKLQPLTGNIHMDRALYVEMWWRIMRHHEHFSTFRGQNPNFSAVLYYYGGYAETDFHAVLSVNNAENTRLQLDRAACETNARRYLRLCDRLLFQFYNDEAHVEPLRIIRASFDAGSSVGDSIGTNELKELMRIFVRTQGLFGDKTDIARAKAQAKARRRAIWQSNRSAR